jgi:hypothetical protein
VTAAESGSATKKVKRWQKIATKYISGSSHILNFLKNLLSTSGRVTRREQPGW